MTPGSLPPRFGVLGSRSFLLDAQRASSHPVARHQTAEWRTLQLALIAIFGAIGTLARYGLQGLVQVRAGSAFPYGTLLINLTGCFFLGLIGQFTMNRLVLPPDWRVAITVGFFGGYTTFSSFGWETAKMLEDGEWLRATAYVGASVMVGLLLSVAGIRLANRF
jgi:fluoride exporter